MGISLTLNDFWAGFNAILPLTILWLWACVLLIVDQFIPKERKGITALLTALGLFAALVVSAVRMGDTAVETSTAAFGGMVTVDDFAYFLNILLTVCGLIAIALAYDYLKRTGLERGEFYILLLFSISGMMLMAVAADLIVVFLALELLSIPLYVLAGFAVPRPDSEEAALKYFLLGAFSSGIFVYGTALVYGATGTTSLSGIIQYLQANDLAYPILLLLGSALVLIGLGFKIAAAPFHMWTPDVYQGAPTPVTAFMAIGAKTAGFAALLRIFVLAFPSLSTDLTPILWGLSALTMILGNVIAIAQSNIKRLLAYSSIAQAGYILMAFVPYGQPGVTANVVAAALFYLVAYAFTNFTAWAVVIALEQAEGKGLEIKDYAGLGRKYPALAAAMTVAMLSFIGVPPTLGFVGKFYLFSAVINGGYVGLAIIGVLTSLISAYYYLRVVVVMYMREGEPHVRREAWLIGATALTAVLTVLLSIFAQPIFQWTSQAVKSFLG